STESMDVASLRSQVALAAVPWLEQVGSGNWKGQLRYRRCGAGIAACGAEGWSGRIQLEDGEFPLPGLAEPLQLESANAQIQGPRVTLDHIRARAGKVPFEGEYHYEPQTVRPHRVRLAIAELDAAELERLLAPTLGRAHGLIARAFGLRRAPVTEWLANRQVEGTVQIGSLALADAHVENVRTHLVWDITRLELDHIQARLEGGVVSGNLA